MHTHKHTHTHTFGGHHRWDKVIIEERVGTASLSPKFERPGSSCQALKFDELLEIRQTLTELRTALFKVVKCVKVCEPELLAEP